MNAESITEEIELIVEIGEAGDALALAKRLAADGQTAWAVDVRRTVTRGELDRNALRAAGGRIAAACRPLTLDLGLLDVLTEMEAGLRAALAADAAMPRAERRASSARQWTERQRCAERVSAYNEQVEFVNRERGRAANRAQAAAVRAVTCGGCFQVPAANGACGC
ncbi:hypothetical protein ABT300_18835 [Streptomyces sp. NPDC001027]|uniref:hypothetical protein n=1 Tax=Streptomyces sp. NPDC001027 TaxID=3154771 RepID=UPI00331714B2